VGSDGLTRNRITGICRTPTLGSGAHEAVPKVAKQKSYMDRGSSAVLSDAISLLREKAKAERARGLAEIIIELQRRGGSIGADWSPFYETLVADLRHVIRKSTAEEYAAVCKIVQLVSFENGVDFARQAILFNEFYDIFKKESQLNDPNRANQRVAALKTLSCLACFSTEEGSFFLDSFQIIKTAASEFVQDEVKIAALEELGFMSTLLAIKGAHEVQNLQESVESCRNHPSQSVQETARESFPADEEFSPCKLILDKVTVEMTTKDEVIRLNYLRKLYKDGLEHLVKRSSFAQDMLNFREKTELAQYWSGNGELVGMDGHVFVHKDDEKERDLERAKSREIREASKNSFLLSS